MTTTTFADHLLTGAHSARPAVTTAPEGTLYSCTDHGLVYKNNGTTWDTWATLGGVGYSPGYEFDHAEYTSGTVAVTATVEASANTVVSGNAVTYDGSTTIEIEFFCPSLAPQATSGIHCQIFLFDGSTSLGLMAQITAISTTQMRWPVTLKRRLTPSSGSHTYSVRAITGSGTATFISGAGGAGAYTPMFIRITNVS